MITYGKILLYWIIVRMAERLFTNDADVNSAFAASSAHYNYAIIYTGSTALLAYFFQRDPKKISINAFTKLQIALYSYAAISAIWSPATLVSIGQAVYSFYGLIFAAALCKYAAQSETPVLAIRRLIRVWIDLLLIEYLVDVVFFFASGHLGPPPIDEKALAAIAALLISLALGERKVTIKRILLLWMFAAGQSFSAIIASAIIFARYVAGRVGKAIGFVFAISLTWAVFEALRLVESGQLSIYGKSWEYILSGSGRFRAWEYLYNEIAMSNWGDIVFGHGFMSEREFLSRQYLSWAIDAHNSILQSLYGLGVVGTLIMAGIWLTPFLTPSRVWQISGDRRFWQILIGCHCAFIVFGLTSSHYFSRPSISAIFMTSIFLILYNMGLLRRYSVSNSSYDSGAYQVASR